MFGQQQLGAVRAAHDQKHIGAVSSTSLISTQQTLTVQRLADQLKLKVIITAFRQAWKPLSGSKTHQVGNGPAPPRA
jgi:hypothetical protein